MPFHRMKFDINILNSCPTQGRVEELDAMKPLYCRSVNSKGADRPRLSHIRGAGEMKRNERMNEMSVEKWWNEICGRGEREKPREKPTQTPFRPPRNTHMYFKWQPAKASESMRCVAVEKNCPQRIKFACRIGFEHDRQDLDIPKWLTIVWQLFFTIQLSDLNFLCARNAKRLIAPHRCEPAFKANNLGKKCSWSVK